MAESEDLDWKDSGVLPIPRTPRIYHHNGNCIYFPDFLYCYTQIHGGDRVYLPNFFKHSHFLGNDSIRKMDLEEDKLPYSFIKGCFDRILFCHIVRHTFHCFSTLPNIFLTFCIVPRLQVAETSSFSTPPTRRG